MTRGRRELLVWLAPVVGAALVVLVYRATYHREQGLYAGAEPALTGALVAAPFVVLALVQVGIALATSLARSPRGRATGAGVAVAAVVVGVVGACVVLRG